MPTFFHLVPSSHGFPWDKFLPPLGGSFFGAFAAFSLGAMQRWMERREKRHYALLAAQTVMLSHENTLHSNFKQFGLVEGVNPFLSSKRYVVKFSKRRVDFDKLDFVADSPDPYLVAILEAAENGFENANRLLDYRNEVIEKFAEDFSSKHPTDIRVQEANYFNQAVPEALWRAKQLNDIAVQRLDTLIKKMFPLSRRLGSGPPPSLAELGGEASAQSRGTTA